MKIKSLLCMLIVLATVLLCGCQNKMEVVDSIPIYEENTADYSLFVPESWIVTIASGVVAAKCAEDDPTSVSVVGFTPSGEGYATVATQWEYVKEQVKNASSEFEVISEADPETEKGYMDIAGEKAGIFEYRAAVGNVKCQYRLAVILHKGELYLVTFCSSVESFDKHEADMDAIFSAFSFDKSKAAPDGMKAAVTVGCRYVLSDEYSISFDEDWTIEASAGVLTARFSSLNSNVSVMKATDAAKNSPTEYFEGEKANLQKELAEFEILSETTDKTIAASDGSFRPAAEYEYRAKIDGTVWRFCQVITKNGDDFYILTFTTVDRYYDSHISYFVLVLDSFVIKV